jgi:hypothetical protein
MKNSIFISEVEFVDWSVAIYNRVSVTPMNYFKAVEVFFTFLEAKPCHQK